MFMLYRDHSTFDLMLAWKTTAGDWTNTVALTTDYLPKLSFEMFDGTAHIAYVTSLNEVAYYHFDPDTVHEIKLAIDGRRIFIDDFELGTFAPWDTVVGAP